MMKPNQLSNFSYNRKQFARFDFKDNQYWMDKYVKTQFNSNQKHIYFHDYRIATLNQEISSDQIQSQKKHNKLPIHFDFFVQNNKLKQLLDNHE